MRTRALSPQVLTRPTQDLWAAAGDQPALESAFAILATPSLVAYLPARQAFAVHSGAFDADGVAAFIRRLHRGSRFKPVAAGLAARDAEGWDGRDAPALEEEFSLEDLMAED